MIKTTKTKSQKRNQKIKMPIKNVMKEDYHGYKERNLIF